MYYLFYSHPYKTLDRHRRLLRLLLWLHRSADGPNQFFARRVIARHVGQLRDLGVPLAAHLFRGEALHLLPWQRWG